jgi:hypothetical protein
MLNLLYFLTIITLLLFTLNNFWCVMLYKRTDNNTTYFVIKWRRHRLIMAEKIENTFVVLLPIYAFNILFFSRFDAGIIQDDHWNLIHSLLLKINILKDLFTTKNTLFLCPVEWKKTFKWFFIWLMVSNVLYVVVRHVLCYIKELTITRHILLSNDVDIAW